MLRSNVRTCTSVWYSLDVFLKEFVGSAVGDFTTAAVILVCVDEKKVARDEMNSATSKT